MNRLSARRMWYGQFWYLYKYIRYQVAFRKVAALMGRMSQAQLHIRITKSKSEENIARCVDYIRVCAILHCFFIDEREVYEGENDEDYRGALPVDGQNVDPELPPAGQDPNDGVEFWDRAMEGVLVASGAPGGIVHFLNRNQYIPARKKEIPDE